jgi:hypothetical protein
LAEVGAWANVRFGQKRKYSRRADVVALPAIIREGFFLQYFREYDPELDSQGEG